MSAVQLPLLPVDAAAHRPVVARRCAAYLRNPHARAAQGACERMLFAADAAAKRAEYQAMIDELKRALQP